MSDDFDNLSPMSGSGSIDAFLGGDFATASIREEFGVADYGESHSIRDFLASPAQDTGPEIDFTGMGLNASAMSNPFMKLPDKIKISSIDQLMASGFLAVGGALTDRLVHRSDRDLWKLTQADGGYVIERMFDAEGNPLKG